MLEIILIIYLSKELGKIIEQKGHQKGWYIALFVISWVLFEFIGILAGTIIFNDSNIFLAYLFALVGAAVAYLLNYILVSSLKDKTNKDPKGEFITYE